MEGRLLPTLHHELPYVYIFIFFVVFPIADCDEPAQSALAPFDWVFVTSNPVVYFSGEVAWPVALIHSGM
jgi:hypothetical protein